MKTDHQNESNIYYKNHLANDFKGPENKRIGSEVDIVCKLSQAKKLNNRLCDAYASMAELEPFKEKNKNYKIKKVKKYFLKKKKNKNNTFLQKFKLNIRTIRKHL